MSARQIERDRRMMARALALAEPMVGRTSPNPAVGCVIARGERIIAEGATAQDGRPHAETIALAQAGARARGATAYVTFEPCSHTGRTPPCAGGLIAAGLARVVVGCVDPYPPVRGRGLKQLEKTGIEVQSGVLEAECRRLNEGFITRVTRHRPFVILKLAMSLDGRIAASSGDSRWISGEESRALSHRWRSECDGVIVGSGTAIADNPRLNCRIAGGRDPVRVVVDSGLEVAPNARLFRLRSQAPALMATTTANLARARRRYAPTEVIAPGDLDGKVSIRALMRELGRRGWNKVMIEGGARLGAAALAAGVVDRIALFVAPRIIGAGTPAIDGLPTRMIRGALKVRNLRSMPIGGDLLLLAEF